jgi:tRNA (guanine26-N2/guanine27-N2)-dimethyltransferase
MATIKEGKAVISVHQGKISKKLLVFYNPVMKMNRDISVLLLNSVKDKDLRIADIMAGSGVRAARFLLELKKGKIKEIAVNDYSKEAVKDIKKNFKLNKIKTKTQRIRITNEDANLLLLNSFGFNYIDIDPFGTPNPFLDSAVKRIARDGILAVTATDTSALAGTYVSACKRKYWAIPLRNEIKHEIGLRILIRKVQLIGAQFEKALTPIFSYSAEHYMRIFFRCAKGKKKVDKVIKQHGHYSNSRTVAGPIWLGQLWDKTLAAKMAKNSDISIPMLDIIKDESKIDAVGFHDIHAICKRNKLKNIPRKDFLIKKIKKKGYKASNTHFSGTGIRSNIKEKELIKIIKSV